MSKLLSLSVDVSKITKDKLIPGKKGKYLKLTVSIGDEKDQYGNDVSCWEEQSKEERDAKKKKNFLGNGKVFWESDSRPSQETHNHEDESEEEDDLPF